MPLPRLPCATALALGLAVAAAPLAAQDAPAPWRASGAFFQGYLAGPIAAISLPLEANDATGSSDEEGSSTPGLFGARDYLVGGVTALAAGVVLANGNDAAPALSSTGTQPVLVPTATLPGAAAPGLVTETNVIVNPEPGTVLLLATGLAVIALFSRRRLARK